MRLLRYTPPLPLKIILVVGGIIWILPLLAFRFDMNVVGMTLVGVVLISILWFNNAGYRIGYDAERLYMRGFGFWNRRVRWPDFHSIRYDDMGLIEPRSQNGGPLGSRYVPAEYLAIVSCRAEDEEIWIYPAALHEAELAPLLAMLQHRRPDLMPHDVTARLEQDGHLPAAV